MATDRISLGNPALPLPRTASASTNVHGRSGEVLTLRIESQTGAGANQVFNGRSADGRLFQLTASMLPGMNLQIGQTVQIQVLGGRSQFELAMLNGSSPSQSSSSSTHAPASLTAAQAQAQMMMDADSEASSRTLDLDQLLLQRFFQGQGSGDVWVLAQAWRHLVVARMRQWQGPSFAPSGVSNPGSSHADTSAVSLALLQAMAPDESQEEGELNPSLFNAATPQSNPALLLPQLWMFHTYVWNNTQPMTFWVLPREEEKSGGGAPRQATRARMLRMRFNHPVHGLLWVDVRVDDIHVMLDIHAEQVGAVDALLLLRPAVSTALAQAGLRLLRFHVQPGQPPRHADDAGNTSLAAQPGGMNTLPAPLSFPESSLAPELFLASVGVMEALRPS